jgi:hypothetical protein
MEGLLLSAIKKTGSLIVYTDMEPDDMLALLLVAKLIKTGVVKAENVFVFIARSTQENWAVISKWLALVNARPNLSDCHVIIAENIDLDIAGRIDAISRTSGESVPVLSLANMYPFFAIYEREPWLLKKVVAVAYGSANIRWALKSIPTEKHGNFMQMLESGFASLHLVESFSLFGDGLNSLNTTKNLCLFLSEFFKVIVEASHDWNRILVSKYLAELSALELSWPLTLGDANRLAELSKQSEPSVQRKIKILLSISPFCEPDTMQIVAADPIAALLAIGEVPVELTGCWQRCTPSLNGEYIKVTKATETSTFHYFNRGDRAGQEIMALCETGLIRSL